MSFAFDVLHYLLSFDGEDRADPQNIMETITFVLNRIDIGGLADIVKIICSEIYEFTFDNIESITFMGKNFESNDLRQMIRNLVTGHLQNSNLNKWYLRILQQLLCELDIDAFISKKAMKIILVIDDLLEGMERSSKEFHKKMVFVSVQRIVKIWGFSIQSDEHWQFIQICLEKLEIHGKLGDHEIPDLIIRFSEDKELRDIATFYKIVYGHKRLINDRPHCQSITIFETAKQLIVAMEIYSSFSLTLVDNAKQLYSYISRIKQKPKIEDQDILSYLKKCVHKEHIDVFTILEYLLILKSEVYEDSELPYFIPFLKSLECVDQRNLEVIQFVSVFINGNIPALPSRVILNSFPQSNKQLLSFLVLITEISFASRASDELEDNIIFRICLLYTSPSPRDS